jgi:hypothetical protein
LFRQLSIKPLSIPENSHYLFSARDIIMRVKIFRQPVETVLYHGQIVGKFNSAIASGGIALIATDHQIVDMIGAPSRPRQDVFKGWLPSFISKITHSHAAKTTAVILRFGQAFFQFQADAGRASSFDGATHQIVIVVPIKRQSDHHPFFHVRFRVNAAMAILSSLIRSRILTRLVNCAR